MLVGTCASRRLTGPRPPTCRATLLAAGTNPEALYEDKASDKKRATPEGYVPVRDWDIEEYRRCPAHLTHVGGGNRLPGFLPAQPACARVKMA
jgi:hypothetical protein